MFLVNSRQGRFPATPSGSKRRASHLSGAPLLPKLRGQIAEFLNGGSLARLRILIPPTSVGLRYGYLPPIVRGFSWQWGISEFAPVGAPHHLSAFAREGICLLPPPTGLDSLFLQAARLPSCVPPSSNGGR